MVLTKKYGTYKKTVTKHKHTKKQLQLHIPACYPSLVVSHPGLLPRSLGQPYWINKCGIPASGAWCACPINVEDGEPLPYHPPNPCAQLNAGPRGAPAATQVHAGPRGTPDAGSQNKYRPAPSVGHLIQAP